MRSLTARLRNHPAHELVSWEPARSVGRFLRTFSRLSGNVGKHSLECFAPGRIGVLRLGFLVLRGRVRVERFHFVRNHRSTIHIYKRSKL